MTNIYKKLMNKKIQLSHLTNCWAKASQKLSVFAHMSTYFASAQITKHDELHRNYPQFYFLLFFPKIQCDIK